MRALLTMRTSASTAVSLLPAPGAPAPGGGYHGPLWAFGVVALLVVAFGVFLRFYRR